MEVMEDVFDYRCQKECQSVYTAIYRQACRLLTQNFAVLNR